jgi:hypothetical protein
MHFLEKFTKKTDFELKTTSATTYRGAILSADTPVSSPPWIRSSTASVEQPKAAVPPPSPPPPPTPTPEELIAPYKQKISELQAELAVERQRMVGVAQRIDQDLVRFESNTRALIIDMALVAAQVFVGSEIPVEAIKNAVAKASETLPITPSMVLFVAAANADAMKDHVPATLKIVVDPALKPGDCRLSSENGGVDARLEVRAQELRQRLIAALLDGRGDAE